MFISTIDYLFIIIIIIISVIICNAKQSIANNNNQYCHNMAQDQNQNQNQNDCLIEPKPKPKSKPIPGIVNNLNIKLDIANQKMRQLQTINQEINIIKKCMIVTCLLFCLFLAMAALLFYQLYLTRKNSTYPNNNYFNANSQQTNNFPLKKQSNLQNNSEISNANTYKKIDKNGNPNTNQNTNIKMNDNKLGIKYAILIDIENIIIEDKLKKQAYDILGSYQIQVGSQLDYGLTKNINFQQLSQNMQSQLQYKQIFPMNTNSLSNQPQYIKKYTQIQSQIQISNTKYQIQQYLLKLPQNINQTEPHPQDSLYKLGIGLIQQPDNYELLQAEYVMMDSKYNIGRIGVDDQIPFCIFTMEHNIYSKNRLSSYFKAISRLNYTNFHIIYIDDGSNDGSAQKIHQFIQQQSLKYPYLHKIKNKIKIIANKYNIGPLANIYYHATKYCSTGQVIVIVDGDDQIVGRQVLKVLSSLYSNPDIWYIYSSYIIQDMKNGYKYKGKQSQYLHYKTSQYRRSFQWQTSHLRTFRQKLLASVPLYSIIEYKYNGQTKKAIPSFYKTAPDLFITFPMMELAGNRRILHIDQFFYHYKGTTANQMECYRYQQVYDDYKCRIKTPLYPLKQLGEKAQMMKTDHINHHDLSIVRQGLDNLELCLNKYAKLEQEIKF